MSVYAQGHVAETLILEQQSEILGQATFRNFELNGVGLAGNVDTVGNDTDLKNSKETMSTLVTFHQLCKQLPRKRASVCRQVRGRWLHPRGNLGG